jgi:hypothetical protein
MPTNHQALSAVLDSLQIAEQRANTCIVSLQTANHQGGAVLGITTLRLIEQAATLRNGIAELRRAVQADAKEGS